MTTDLPSDPHATRPSVVCPNRASADVRKHTSTLALDTASLRLSAALVPWDTESFHVPVAQVHQIEVRDWMAAHTDMQRLLVWLETQRVALACCRLDHARLHESAALERVGFRFIEMVYGMQFDLRHLPPRSDRTREVQFHRAQMSDLAELQVLAAETFTTGRWNIDWSVGQTLGGRRYADWIARSLADPAHQVFRAVVDDQTVGLFIVETVANGSAYWHLTAVAPRWQGQGLGKAIWASMLHRHAYDGATQVNTMIAARNMPVVNLYARLGWRFVDCQMTYHWASSRWLARVGESLA